MAAAGYPDNPRKGDAIDGLPAPVAALHVFHAGTALHAGKLVTSGGRVLCVTGLGDSVRITRQLVYRAADAIRFAGSQMRRDIGWRALQGQRKPA